MPDYSSLYRAKLVQATPTVLTVFVPQVFGDVPIDVTEWIGTPVQGMGWLFFQAGNPEHPVWMSPQGGASGGGGGGEGQDEVFIGPSNPGTGFELWYDTDDPGQPTDLVWVGPNAPTNPTTEIWWDTDEPTTSEQFVNTSGDTMAGPLVLHADPVAPLEPATKQYVDATTPSRGGMVTPTGSPLTTAGTTDLTLISFATTLTEPGRIFVIASVNVVQTVATDIFQLWLRYDTLGTVVAAQQGASLRWGGSPCGIVTVAAGVHTFSATLQRQSGTGTATVSVGAFCRLSHMIMRGGTG